jgi:hypothetical protein
MAMLGDNTDPVTEDQTAFASVLAVIGLGIVSTVIGALSAIITTMDALEIAKDTHLNSIKSYLRFQSVSPDTTAKIRDFYKVGREQPSNLLRGICFAKPHVLNYICICSPCLVPVEQWEIALSEANVS